ncbi:hypothetical protein CORC01_06492 [Colletotrichum orchidophilum]|uniref:Uncharacterized protein n=1 Tax=Colletotrichum orchidophilum TaxID=1209926 RepID=A0A1G4BAD6_9PEZI|nr:uncharacterized protein CORC01_06492 [Colletotrichum orchidophilum]OHE98295.1 hypothetical protein CORC01_06492 [Colletotrichum orchidophilum]
MKLVSQAAKLLFIAAPIAAQTTSETFLYSILPTDVLTPLPTPAQSGCPTVTELSLCPSCAGEAPQCLEVATLTQSCGCPTSVTTESFTFGCEKGTCPRVGCSTSYTIISGEEACTGSAGVSATAATTASVTATTQATTAATGSQAGTASVPSGSSTSASATPNAAGRLAVPFKFW